MIFCNEYDRPASYFVDADKDKNPSAKLHTSIVTVANAAAVSYTHLNIVKLIKAKDIRKFIRGWAQDSFLSRDIRN